LSHACAFSRAREAPHNVDQQRGAECVLKRCTHTYFVENEHGSLSLRFVPVHFLLYHPAGSCVSGTRRTTSDSMTTLCSMWT